MAKATNARIRRRTRLVPRLANRFHGQVGILLDASCRSTPWARYFERHGKPPAFHLTGGRAADCKAYDTLIALPEIEPAALPGDKGYDADAIRDDLRRRGIDAVIPGRSNRKKPIIHDPDLYKERNRIERMFGHLKINRAIATR